MKISQMVKFNDIISECMKATTAHSLILFNFFKGEEKQRENVLVSLKLMSLCFFLKVPF